MGWWDTQSSKWQMGIVAQMGGAAGIGAGVFFLQFRSPDVPVKPVFVAVAGGIGVGGSVGSGVSVPYSDIVRQIINPKFKPPGDSYYSDLAGSFSCGDIQREGITFGQMQASAVAIGVQTSSVRCTDVNMFGPSKLLFETVVKIPKNLPQVGQALLDLPAMQGGWGLGAFLFSGTLFHIGTS
jgi:hypothetical protein